MFFPQQSSTVHKVQEMGSSYVIFHLENPKSRGSEPPVNLSEQTHNILNQWNTLHAQNLVSNYRLKIHELWAVPRLPGCATAKRPSSTGGKGSARRLKLAATLNSCTVYTSRDPHKLAAIMYLVMNQYEQYFRVILTSRHGIPKGLKGTGGGWN